MATIYDVAERAQVSVATVSHVLNRTRYVLPQTERRVRAAAEALRYRPNHLARSLRRRETHTIGLLVPDNANPFFADVARAVEDAGFAKGYNVFLCNSDMSEAKYAAYADALLAKQVDGLILVSSELISTSHGTDPLERIVDARVPVVVVDRKIDDDLPVGQVLIDNEGGGYLAGQYLASLGHRRIGAITGPSNLTPFRRREDGFRRALTEAGLQLATESIVQKDMLGYRDGAEAMRELLRRSPGITAVFAFNDMMAIGAIAELRRAGLGVPDDVSVIGFDDIAQASTAYPTITTIAQPKAEMGRASVGLLLDRISAGDGQASTSLCLSTKLVERDSCRAPD